MYPSSENLGAAALILCRSVTHGSSLRPTSALAAVWIVGLCLRRASSSLDVSMRQIREGIPGEAVHGTGLHLSSIKSALQELSDARFLGYAFHGDGPANTRKLRITLL